MPQSSSARNYSGPDSESNASYPPTYEVAQNNENNTDTEESRLLGSGAV
jgi:hypothetical protein